MHVAVNNACDKNIGEIFHQFRVICGLAIKSFGIDLS